MGNNVNRINNQMYDIEKKLETIRKKANSRIAEKELCVSNIGTILPDGSINDQNHIPATRQTIRKFLNGYSDFNTSQLLSMCNLLDCSVHYLLDECDDFSTKELEIASKETNLDEDAIRALKSFSQEEISLLNELLNNDNFHHLIHSLAKYKTYATMKPIDSSGIHTNDYDKAQERIPHYEVDILDMISLIKKDLAPDVIKWRIFGD